MTKVYCFSSSYMQFAELLREYLPDVPVVNINPSSTGVVDAEEERDLLENAEVVVGDPKISAIYMFRCRKLKWFHSIYAGVDDILNNAERLKLVTPYFGNVFRARKDIQQPIR